MSNPTNYLVVCRALKRAVSLCHELIEYLVDNHIPCRVVKRGPYILVDVIGLETIIRFTSERKCSEAMTGFIGWAVTGEQVEEWLDAAKEHEK